MSIGMTISNDASSVITKGVFICAFGKPGYGYAAYNLAFSIKYHSPGIKVALLTDGNAISYLDKSWLHVFDSIIQMPEELKGREPGLIKISFYDYLPFDYNLILDADAIAIKDINPVFDELIATGKPYLTHVVATHTIDKGNDFKEMQWAWANDIWWHFNLPQDAVLPATNSSFQFVKKCDEAAALYKQIKENFSNAIPLSRLRMQWGGSQPDELYLNIALAQKKMDASTKRQYIFFASKDRKETLSHVADNYYFLSIYGRKNFIRPEYKEWYDRQLTVWHREKRLNFYTKYNTIANDKHANNKPRPEARAIQEVVKIANRRSCEKVILITSYYIDSNLERQKELEACLVNNIKAFDHIYLITEHDVKTQSANVTAVNLAKRPSYNDLIAQANKYSDNNTIVVIANADIYFEEDSVNKLKQIDFENTALCLTRWDRKTDGTIIENFNPGSQDAWIVKGKFPEGMDCDFTLGHPQCDHRFAYELAKTGYRLSNPTGEIKAIHIHNSALRNYNPNARLAGGQRFVEKSSFSSIAKKKLLLIQPGHFGDIMICLPMVRKWAEKYLVDWQCPVQYHEMFRDIDYCQPLPAADASQYDKVVDLSFGFGGKPESWWQQNKQRFNSFVEAKYELAGEDVSLRWSLQWNRNKEKENQLYEAIVDMHGEDYVLVHTEYGIKINPESSFPMVKAGKMEGFNIFDWYKVIINADEIHCVDSSFCNFVEVIEEAKNIPKFYYPGKNVPNKWDETLLRGDWKRVESRKQELQEA